MRFLLATILLSLFMSIAATTLAATIFDEQLGAAGKSAEGLVGAKQGEEQKGLPTYLARIINATLGLLGTIAIILIVYAGFLWMTSGGNEETVTKAKGLLGNAVIGLILILTAYAITRFIFAALISKTTTI